MPTPEENNAALGKVQSIRLKDLRFDMTNPRYGPDAPKQHNDKDALDYIMSRFDMSDVLSSISVNGFFDSEPLVGIANDDGSVKILEGNRRLAACLVLANDPRAVAHKKKKEAHPLRAGISIDEIPVMVYPRNSGTKHLLPYLGVRHIVGGRPWDSYAKAHWVAVTLDTPGNELRLSDIEAMLGDTKGLTKRLLGSYRIVQQLQAKDLFEPSDSVKKGKGSASFPFSLIYNALDIGSLRKWIELPGDERDLSPNPIPPGRLADTAALVRLICGSTKDDFPPAIKDSREIRALSQAVQNRETYTLLKQGASVEDVEREIMAPDERVLENLVASTPLLEDCVTVLTKTPLSPGEASRLFPIARKVRLLAISVGRTLRFQSGEDEDV